METLKSEVNMLCWKCGAEASKSRDLSEPVFFYNQILDRKEKPDKYKRCFCDKCFDEYIRTLQEENKLYIILKKKRMFEKALDRMERQRFLFEEYKEAIQAVEEYNLEHLDKFDSSYEIIAAIVFIQNRIRIKPQYKIGTKSVDFFLPDYNVIVEIDGDRHTKARDASRDAKIKKTKPDVQIIHIKTEYMDKDASKLIDAINAVIRYRSTYIWSTKPDDQSGIHEGKT